MTNLTILSESIRQLDNLYSLNDLHKASGAAKKHQVTNFMRMEQTQELISEIQTSDLRFENKECSSYMRNGQDRSPNLVIGAKVIKGGANQGTWVCKELVYAYAMWISAKFSLMVIRAFDEMQNEPQQIAPAISYQRTRLLMVIENGQVTQSQLLKSCEGVVSFESPEILREMLKDVMPGYQLVKKADILKALNFG